VLLLATTAVGSLESTFAGLESEDNLRLRAYFSGLDSRIPFYISLATNTIVTFLSAGRIWWVSREIRASLGKDVVKKYNTAIMMIVESGAIFSVSILIYLVVLSTDPPDIFYSTERSLIPLPAVLHVSK